MPMLVDKELPGPLSLFNIRRIAIWVATLHVCTKVLFKCDECFCFYHPFKRCIVTGIEINLTAEGNGLLPLLNPLWASCQENFNIYRKITTKAGFMCKGSEYVIAQVI